MRRIIFVFFFLITLSIVPFSVSADTRVGFILGDPTGVTALFEERIAVAAAWDFSNYLHVHGDIWIIRDQLPIDTSDPLTWYFGGGAKLLVFNSNSSSDTSSGESIGVGLRAPFGIRWHATNRLEVFGEIVPGMFLFPGTDPHMDFGVGLRYLLDN